MTIEKLRKKFRCFDLCMSVFEDYEKEKNFKIAFNIANEIHGMIRILNELSEISDEERNEIHDQIAGRLYNI